MRWLVQQIRQQFVGFIAIFIVLGGVSYAAATLPVNSVGSKQIKANAVKSSDVKDGSLRAKDFGSGQLSAGATGATGAAGPQGNPGPKGAPGPTASAFAENSTDVNLEPSPTVVNQATIVTTVQSRIVAQASVDLVSTTAANVYCFISDNPSLSGLNDWSIRTNDDFNGSQNTGIVGAKVLPPGTYTIYVGCGRNSGTVSHNESDFALIAAGV